MSTYACKVRGRRPRCQATARGLGHLVDLRPQTSVPDPRLDVLPRLPPSSDIRGTRRQGCSDSRLLGAFKQDLLSSNPPAAGPRDVLGIHRGAQAATNVEPRYTTRQVGCDRLRSVGVQVSGCSNASAGLAQLGLALSTEAQWECAARPGTDRPLFTGADPASQPNAGFEPGTSKLSALDLGCRTIRGGASNPVPALLRASNRSAGTRDERPAAVGVRPVRVAVRR